MHVGEFSLTRVFRKGAWKASWPGSGFPVDGSGVRVAER